MTGFTRRGAAAGLLGAAAAAGAAPAYSQGTNRKTFVLVHGTWHGGWCWVHVADRLRAQGHRVITPTVTGCGDRAHLIQPETGLETHITDIVRAIEWEELEDVILIGHSFSGITITGVADRIPDRIRHIAFFDALIPTDARRAAIMPDPETGAYPQWWLDRLPAFEDGYKMNFWDHYPAKMLVPEDDEANIAWLRRRLTWHPVRQWTDQLELRNGGWAAHPRTCIHCVGQVYSPSSEAMVGPGRGPGWRFIELNTARNGFMTDPDAVTECFLSLA
ncbi:MAG: alpha/beta hydrolase [Alphaproteobacteria bacterium]|nr:alpha/beta hydrolase [Alphaproteobacteria bacterium]